MTAPAAGRGTLHAAVSLRPRPTPPGMLPASLTFGWRALLKIRHVPQQLADVIGIPLLFTLMFTYLFGDALAGSPHAYLQFLLPGSLALAVLFLTVYSGVTLNRDLSAGTFDRFRSLPIRRGRPDRRRPARRRRPLPARLGPGHRAGPGHWLSPPRRRRRRARRSGPRRGVRIQPVLGLDRPGADPAHPQLGHERRLHPAVPLTFISNIFVPPLTMPPWLRAAARLNPVTHLVTASRGLMSGTATAGQIEWALAAAAALTALFAPLALRLYRNKH